MCSLGDEVKLGNIPFNWHSLFANIGPTALVHFFLDVVQDDHGNQCTRSNTDTMESKVMHLVLPRLIIPIQMDMR